MTPAMKFGAVCAWSAAAFMVFIAFGSTQVGKTQDYGELQRQADGLPRKNG